MRVDHGRVVEVDSLAQFDALVEQGARSMRGWRLQDLDLRTRSDTLTRLEAAGSLFLGVRLGPDTEHDLRTRGALVFPTVPDVPFDAYRGDLYTAEELYDGLRDGYARTPDARIYAWSRQAERDQMWTLAQALHDHAIDNALEEFAQGRRIVGVMGGHALERGSEDYRDASLLGRDLERAGLCVATGGGPGAMEAANLGSYLAGFDDQVIGHALVVLAGAATFKPSVDEWALAAFRVREMWPNGKDSLGIPTWFYGHEPPNVFAGRIAKFFKNATREDTLLHVCTNGIVFLPGAAGTLQEVFQDACENYYAQPSTLAPMVLVGREYWTRTLPAWPLLEALARRRPMSSAIHLVDHPNEVPGILS